MINARRLVIGGALGAALLLGGCVAVPVGPGATYAGYPGYYAPGYYGPGYYAPGYYASDYYYGYAGPAVAVGLGGYWGSGYRGRPGYGGRPGYWRGPAFNGGRGGFGVGRGGFGGGRGGGGRGR